MRRVKNTLAPTRFVRIACAAAALTLVLTACDERPPLSAPTETTGEVEVVVPAEPAPEPTVEAPTEPEDVVVPTAPAEPVETPAPVVEEPEPEVVPVDDAATPEPAGRAAFPENAVGDYQLGGAYTPAAEVTLVVRDSTAEPAPGLYNVCYVNGFQTQPGDSDAWLAEHPELVLRTAAGKPVVDPGWPDEYILDVSTEAKREAIADIMAGTMATCAERGFDAVELDNLDSYSRSGGALDLDDTVAAAHLYVERGHALGLAVGQKNTAELEARGRDEIGFDFAIVEECGYWEECDVFTDVYGSAVFAIEYPDDGDFAATCAVPGRPANMVLRDHDLVTPSHEDYVYERC